VKASFTPSKSPYNSVWLRACCVGRTEKEETAAVVDAKIIAVAEVPFIVEIIVIELSVV